MNRVTIPKVFPYHLTRKCKSRLRLFADVKQFNLSSPLEDIGSENYENLEQFLSYAPNGLILLVDKEESIYSIPRNLRSKLKEKDIELVSVSNSDSHFLIGVLPSKRIDLGDKYHKVKYSRECGISELENQEENKKDKEFKMRFILIVIAIMVMFFSYSFVLKK